MVATLTQGTGLLSSSALGAAALGLAYAGLLVVLGLSDDDRSSSGARPAIHATAWRVARRRSPGGMARAEAPGESDVTATKETRDEAAREFPKETLSLVRAAFSALNREESGTATGRAPAVCRSGWQVAPTSICWSIAPTPRASPQPCATLGSSRSFRTAARRSIGVEDWLGHDAESGRLVHLHVYYRLVLGEDHVKNHVLPIEAAVLDDVVLRHGVKVPVAASELTILTIRALLKYRRTDALKDALRVGRRGGVPPNVRHEVADLRARVATGGLQRAAQHLVPSVPGAASRTSWRSSGPTSATPVPCFACVARPGAG